MDALHNMSGVVHDLLRDAADVDAGAAQGALLADGDFGTMRRRAARARDAAAAGADHEVVEVPACVRCRNLDDRAALLKLRTLQSACLTLWLQRRLYAACCRRAVFWLTAAAREHSQGA